MHTTATRYVRLAGIHVIQASAVVEIRLVCEEDEAGEAFYASCDSRCALYLDPFLTWLDRYHSEGIDDQPVVPIFSRSGGATLDLRSVERDYPEVVDRLNQFLNAGQAPSSEEFAAKLQRLSWSG